MSFVASSVGEMELLESNIEVTKRFVKENLSYLQISEELKKVFPEVRRGLSARNIRLFCAKHSINKKDAEVEVDSVVQQCINEV